MTVYGKANGTINFTREHNDDGTDLIIAKWLGGDLVAFSKEFLDESDPQLVRVDGKNIQVGQFRLEIIEEDETTGLSLARRIQ